MARIIALIGLSADAAENAIGCQLRRNCLVLQAFHANGDRRHRTGYFPIMTASAGFVPVICLSNPRD